MSTDPTSQDEASVPGDGALLADLRSFGLTLEADLGASIRPAATPAEKTTERSEHEDGRAAASPSGRRSPGRAVVWALAAAVLVVAGFGLGAVWRDRTATIDSVGPNEDDGRDVGEQGREGSASDEDGIDDGSDGQSAPVTEVVPSPPPSPSVIIDATGQVVATIDDPGQIWTDEGVGPDDDSSRVAPADDPMVELVVQELLRVDAFIGLDRPQLAELLATGGLQVITTLDPEVDRQAIAAIDESYPNEGGQPFEPGLVILDNESGAITAVSSRDPLWNGLVTEPRMTGSAFKSLVLAQAYADGFSPDDQIRADGPCTFQTEEAGDYTVGGSFRAAQSIAAVTRSSNNCAYVRLAIIVGVDRVVGLAEELGLGLPAEADQLLSLPLGVAELSAVDLAGAYAAFANDGVFEEPWMVDAVLDRDGSPLYQHRADSRRVLDVQTARLVNQTLVSVVESGTGVRAQLDGGHVAAGKTGTTNGFTDAWFVGYTRRFTAAVWLGQPADPVSGNAGPVRIRVAGWNSFGGGLPATVWGLTMNQIHADLAPAPFIEPDRPPAAADGVKLLKVPGELDFCDGSVPPVQETQGTVVVDTNGDGRANCFELSTGS